MIKTLNSLILVLIMIHLGFLANDQGIRFVLGGPAVLETGFFGAMLLLQNAQGKIRINPTLVMIVIATAVVGYLSTAGING